MKGNIQTGKKLAVFDLDGTLFDTKDVNYTAYSQALAECGVKCEIDYRFYCNFCNGNSYRVFLPLLVPGITESGIQKVHEAKMRIYKDCLEHAWKNNHLFSMIKLMKEEYLIAVATTASRVNTEDILNCFSVKEMFDFIITREDVVNAKPAPDCFVKAMSMAGVSSEDTIIFEDSETGLAAAAASGAKYVKVYGYN